MLKRLYMFVFAFTISMSVSAITIDSYEPSSSVVEFNVTTPTTCFRDRTSTLGPDGNYYYYYPLHTPVNLTLPNSGEYSSEDLSNQVELQGYCSGYVKLTYEGIVWEFNDWQEQYHDDRTYGNPSVVGIKSCDATCSIYPDGYILTKYDSGKGIKFEENVPSGISVKVMMISYSEL